jgi:LuxR family maltose regulon positive regulatory protein
LFELDQFKLQPPPPRSGIVARTGIVERLIASDQCQVVAVVAPAGYGKTTLLAQWSERKQPRVAWLSADDRDNDPAVLLTYLAVALDRVERIDPRVFRSLATPGTGIAGVTLVASIMSMVDPVVMVLDQADALTNPECHDIIAELAMRLPVGSQLAIGSRREVPVPVPRLRAQGGLVEVGVDELAMDGREARSLLVDAGVTLQERDVQELVERTEGWPAGLYLAALAINAGSRVDERFRFTGDDRFMGDYLRSEFLDRVARAEVSFLTRTSILDRMSGPLCDATVGRGGSARVLDRLERSNLLVVPLDRRSEWYRYHHLFRELLHAELMQREPEMVPELHSRAASWCEANNLPEAAITHAQHAGDPDRVARLVLRHSAGVWASGRLDTVLGWVEWFSTNGLIESHPAIAVHGALTYALIGKAADAERLATAAERTTSRGALPDGNSIEGTLAYLRTLLCRNGIDEMRRDAQIALQGLAPTSPYRPAMLHAEGVGRLLQGDPDQADVFFIQAVDEATSAGVVPFIPALLAERGLAALERDDWPEAETLATQALAIMGDGRFDDYWSSALVYAWSGRLAARRGDVTQARDLVARAARLRPLLTYALPIVSVQALVELAHAYIAVADLAGARAVLRQIADIHQRRPELGRLSSQANELRSKVDMLRGDMVGLSSLTTAELRLLPLLPTYLSLEEISQRLAVSRNTVKSQAISIYRKLGASSRGETVTRLHQLGIATAP